MLQIRCVIVVGYQGRNCATKGYFITVPMFQGIGDGKIYLKDIVPSSEEEIGEDEISLMVMDTQRTIIGNYGYRPYSTGKGGAVTLAGWYDEEEQLDTTTGFTYGSGFMVKCDYPVTLTFAGQVVTSKPCFVVPAKGYYRCGNITPVPVNMKDIKPTAEDEIGEDEVSIMTYDKDRKQTGNYGYRPYSTGKGGAVTLEGWYDEEEQLVTDKVFQPGDGFVLKSDYAITLNFPEPIKKAE